MALARIFIFQENILEPGDENGIFVCCHFRSDLLLKKWAIPGLFFHYFRLFSTVESKQMFNKFCR